MHVWGWDGRHTAPTNWLYRGFRAAPWPGSPLGHGQLGSIDVALSSVERVRPVTARLDPVRGADWLLGIDDGRPDRGLDGVAGGDGPPRHVTGRRGPGDASGGGRSRHASWPSGGPSSTTPWSTRSTSSRRPCRRWSSPPTPTPTRPTPPLASWPRWSTASPGADCSTPVGRCRPSPDRSRAPSAIRALFAALARPEPGIRTVGVSTTDALTTIAGRLDRLARRAEGEPVVVPRLPSGRARRPLRRVGGRARAGRRGRPRPLVSRR